MGIRWIAKLKVSNYEIAFVFSRRPTWQRIEDALVDAYDCELLRGDEYHTFMREMPGPDACVWDMRLDNGSNKVVCRELEIILTKALGG